MTYEGWALSSDSDYYHYFVDRVPLCNGCGLPVGECEQGNDDSDENCKRCKALLKKRKQVGGISPNRLEPLKPFVGAEECSVCHKPSEKLYKGVCQYCRLHATWRNQKAQEPHA